MDKKYHNTDLNKIDFQAVLNEMESGKAYSEMEMKAIFNQVSGGSFICNDYFKNTVLKAFRNKVTGLEVSLEGQQKVYTKTTSEATAPQEEEEKVPLTEEETPLALSRQEWKDALAVAAVFKKWDSEEIPHDLFREDLKNIGYCVNNIRIINKVFENLSYPERVSFQKRGEDKKLENLIHPIGALFDAVVQAATEHEIPIPPTLDGYLSGEVIQKEEEETPAVVKKPFKPLHWKDAFIALSIFLKRESETVSFDYWMQEISRVSQPGERQTIIKNANNVFEYIGLPLITIDKLKIIYGGNPQESYDKLTFEYNTFADEEPELSAKTEEPVKAEILLLLSGEEHIKKLVRQKFMSYSPIDQNVVSFVVINDRRNLINLLNLLLEIELSEKSLILGTLNSEGIILKKVQKKLSDIKREFAE